MNSSFCILHHEKIVGIYVVITVFHFGTQESLELGVFWATEPEFYVKI